MADNFSTETAIAAGIGCATGILWSSIAGYTDLDEAKAWLFGGTACVGSAATSASIYAVSRYASEDRALARGITAGWFGVQATASLTNWIGLKNNWQEKPGFNAVALPLNYAAAPLSSTLSLMWAGVGMSADGFRAGSALFAGTWVFNHQLCPEYYRVQFGAIGHNCSTNQRLDRRFHEVGHAVQSSILGDVGIILIGGLTLLQPKHDARVLEQWADELVENIDLTPSLRETFQLPEEAKVERDKEGLYQVWLKKALTLEGREYSPEQALLFGTTMQGQWRLLKGTLAREANISGFCFKQGTTLQFNGLGEVERISFGAISERILYFPDQAKNMPYHCGVEETPRPQYSVSLLGKPGPF
jgi:hypothetical protein